MSINLMNPIEVVSEEVKTKTNSLPCVFIDSRIKKLNKEAMEEINNLKLDYINIRNSLKEFIHENWEDGRANYFHEDFEMYATERDYFFYDLDSIECQVYSILWKKSSYKPSIIHRVVEFLNRFKTIS